ncbi:hypothetical protein ACFL7M_05110 [Thermodesulfobacteriota bacterium]
MSVEDISIESPIEEKISWAERFYQSKKDQLLGDGIIDNLLIRLKKAVHASRGSMAEAGVECECRRCEDREGGSCCGIGLENKYSDTLLLINLLLDLDLPRRRHDPQGCYFLGEAGCLLLARHVICVNYLCKKITAWVDPEKIAKLREKEGIELELLFFLNERIKTVLKDISV